MRPGRSPFQIVEDYLSILTSKLKSKIRLGELVEEEVIEDAPLRRK